MAIIEIRRHSTVETIGVVAIPVELAHDMGRFGFAKWHAHSKAYWVEDKHLSKLTDWMEREGHTILDLRHQAAEERYSGPLPECRSCGQPAKRSTSLALTRCPACGDKWDPVVHLSADQVARAAVTRDCTSCGKPQHGAFAYCGRCGAEMPPMAASTPSAEDREAAHRRAASNREPLQDPLQLGDLIPEHLADGIAAHTEETG